MNGGPRVLTFIIGIHAYVGILPIGLESPAPNPFGRSQFVIYPLAR